VLDYLSSAASSAQYGLGAIGGSVREIVANPDVAFQTVLLMDHYEVVRPPALPITALSTLSLQTAETVFAALDLELQQLQAAYEEEGGGAAQTAAEQPEGAGAGPMSSPPGSMGDPAAAAVGSCCGLGHDVSLLACATSCSFFLLQPMQEAVTALEKDAEFVETRARSLGVLEAFLGYGERLGWPRVQAEAWDAYVRTVREGVALLTLEKLGYLASGGHTVGMGVAKAILEPIASSVNTLVKNGAHVVERVRGRSVSPMVPVVSNAQVAGATRSVVVGTVETVEKLAVEATAKAAASAAAKAAANAVATEAAEAAVEAAAEAAAQSAAAGAASTATAAAAKASSAAASATKSFAGQALQGGVALINRAGHYQKVLMQKETLPLRKKAYLTFLRGLRKLLETLIKQGSGV
jgi:hypothetical protein